MRTDSPVARSVSNATTEILRVTAKRSLRLRPTLARSVAHGPLSVCAKPTSQEAPGATIAPHPLASVPLKNPQRFATPLRFPLRLCTGLGVSASAFTQRDETFTLVATAGLVHPSQAYELIMRRKREALPVIDARVRTCLRGPGRAPGNAKNGPAEPGPQIVENRALQ